MESKTFSIAEALRFGWRTTFRHFWLFVGVLLISGAVQLVPQVVSSLARERALLTFAIMVVFAVLSMIVQMGIVNMTIRFARDTEAHFADLFAVSHLFWKFLGASILYMLIIAGGMLLLIVPGIIWAIKYQFFSYVIIDEGVGPLTALRRSGEITQGVKWNLLFFGILLGFINILGVLALFIGLFVTTPVTMLATAYVYRTLVSQTYGVQPEPVNPRKS